MANMQLGPKTHSLPELREIAWRLSRQIIQITTRAGSGHPSSSLSAIDILVALYFGGALSYDPARPDWPDRDRFILSKGHGAPALYAVLAEAGYYHPDLLSSLRRFGSPLEGHPNMLRTPGVEASTGSLGQGLSIALGHALAARLDRRSFRVYAMIGDGEADEGEIWEAAMTASKYHLTNLTAILDRNGFQQTGSTDQVMPALEPLAAKWEAFGWRVLKADGHNLEQILEALNHARQETSRPQMIIAHTLKGKGLSPFEKDSKRKHGKPLTPEEEKVALAELDLMYSSAAGRR